MDKHENNYKNLKEAITITEALLEGTPLELPEKHAQWNILKNQEVIMKFLIDLNKDIELLKYRTNGLDVI